MKVKKINKFIGFFLSDNYIGITLAPFGIYLEELYWTPKVINHESIHWKQQMEMGIIFFYLWYILEWLIKLCFFWGAAYDHLSFEQEAYSNSENLDYLKTRRHYSWVKYILK